MSRRVVLAAAAAASRKATPATTAPAAGNGSAVTPRDAVMLRQAGDHADPGDLCGRGHLREARPVSGGLPDVHSWYQSDRPSISGLRARSRRPALSQPRPGTSRRSRSVIESTPTPCAEPPSFAADSGWRVQAVP